MNDSNQKENIHKKSTYLLLLIFLGFTGAHKFYSKNYKKAKLMLSLFLLVMLSLLIACLDGLLNLKLLDENKPFFIIYIICSVLLPYIACLLLLLMYLFDLIKALIFNPIKFYIYEPIVIKKNRNKFTD